MTELQYIQKYKNEINTLELNTDTPFANKGIKTSEP